jgi:alkylation response protein AidB-like acyl-CoA dehydrogenase
MNALTDQQRMLADSARQFCAGEHEPQRVRACRGRDPDFDREVWRKVAEIGWLGIVLPESDGGLGLGFGELAEVLEPWGAACAPEPLVAAAVLAGRALVHGEGPARAGLLERLVAGELIPALAWVDASGEVQAVRATKRPGTFVLDGETRYVAPADSDGWVVYARDANDAWLLWVDRDEPGTRIEREPRADGTFAARVSFTGCAVPDSASVATPARADLALSRALDEARIALALEMTGTMQRIVELTLEYLRTRVQFGKPIGSFQALQHRAVDLFVACELARDVARAAARLADGEGDALTLSLWAARAKARAADALSRIAREAVQLHGAIGFTDEYALGVYVNRALVQCVWLGSASAMRRRYAELAPPFDSEPT